MRQRQVPVPRPIGLFSIGVLIGCRAHRRACFAKPARCGAFEGLLGLARVVFRSPCNQRRTVLQPVRAGFGDPDGHGVAGKHRLVGSRDPPAIDEGVFAILDDPGRVGIAIAQRRPGLDVEHITSGERDAHDLDRPFIGGDGYGQINLGVAPRVDVPGPSVRNRLVRLDEIVEHLALQLSEKRSSTGLEIDAGGV